MKSVNTWNQDYQKELEIGKLYSIEYIDHSSRDIDGSKPLDETYVILKNFGEFRGSFIDPFGLHHLIFIIEKTIRGVETINREIDILEFAVIEANQKE